jgi:hypothetical protein
VANLYGVESEDDCRREIDELLALVEQARAQPTKDTVGALNSRLTYYYKRGDSQKGRNQMSRVEESYFGAAVQGAYVERPNLNERSEWNSALYEVEEDLQYYRPKEPKA